MPNIYYAFTHWALHSGVVVTPADSRGQIAEFYIIDIPYWHAYMR